MYLSKNTSDSRPYLDVCIKGKIITGLLDTGAMTTVLGKGGLELILKMKFKVNKCSTLNNVSTADGKSQVIYGRVLLPITVRDKTKELDVLIVPSIRQNLILGADFCQLFSVSLDFSLGSYNVASLDLNEIIVKEHFRNVEIQTETDLTSEQKLRLAEVVKHFDELVSDTLGCTDLLEHKIEVNSNEPFRKRPFLLSPYMQEHLTKEVNRMLELGLIRPSTSPYSANVLLVKKDSGEYRTCYDGRPLNSISVPQPYPLPYLRRILDKVKDAKFLTSIDLKHAYWQIKLSPESCKYTAFSIVGLGHFEFVRMPFGLMNASQTMQKLMDRLFPPSIENNIFVYLDDLIVCNNSFESHIETLTKVYEVLKFAGLTINAKKSLFCKPSLAFLGFIVDKNGLHTNPQKVESILNYKKPETVTQLKRFLGMAGWYSRFIKSYSDLVVPLNAIMKGRQKRQSITWNAEANEAFENIKACLISTPVLRNPDFSKQFTIQTDASRYALGAVITQGEGEDEYVVAYTSRVLNKAERNYDVTTKECLAIVHAVQKFRCYVEGTKFKIITDHHSLIWLKRLENPTGKLCRWSIFHNLNMT